VPANLLRRYTAALVLSLSLASPAAARAVRPQTPARAIEAASIHVANFGRVDSTYYRGGQPEGEDYADLAALGVKTLVNLTSDDADTHEQSMASRAGLAYFEIPMTTHQPPTAAQIDTFLKIVKDPSNQPVYVHCVGGRHRTGVMTAVYRLTHDGWTADRAFKEMKQYKFGADFLHPEFKSFVYRYGSELARTSAAPAAATTAKPGGLPRH